MEVEAADNQRKTTVVVTHGVTVHNGPYSYNGAGRLSQCVDAVMGLTEEYTCNNNGTLSSAPGSGYTRLFFYNEESQLITIQHNTGGTITTAYEYGYAADGGRRWRKDIANNVWTWYPCGAACKAGALVEQTSDLTGATWTTSALYLRTGGSCGSKLIRRVSSTDSEYHHNDIVGNFGLITASTATVLSNNLYDGFGVQQYANGNAQTQWRSTRGYNEVENLLANCWIMPDRDISFTETCRRGGWPSWPPPWWPWKPKPVPIPLPIPPVPGFTFQCYAPPWWQQKLWGVHSYWCRACGAACAIACEDDIDCIIACHARQVNCLRNGGNYIF